jgi:hypothetical protein
MQHGSQRTREVVVLEEHDGLGDQLRVGTSQEAVAGVDESGDFGGGVVVAGPDDVGVHGAHFAGEGSADGSGVGIGGDPEPGGRTKHPYIMPPLRTFRSHMQSRAAVRGMGRRPDEASARPVRGSD